MVYEKKNRSLVFSGSRKIPTRGSTVQWETRQASFPTGTVGPRVGIFLSPLNTNDGFYLSHTLVPALGKDKKNEQQHAGLTSIRDVIVMLNDVTMSHLSVFRIFWKSFPHFSNINEVFSGEHEKVSIMSVRVG